MIYKLIAIDIDGTLLTTQRTITPRTSRAIDAAVAAGVCVVLCTGRSLHSGHQIAEQVNRAAHLVFHSGALILERLNGPVLRAINMSRDLARTLVAFLKAEGYDPLVYDPVPESRHYFYERDRTPNEWRRRYIEGSAGRGLLVPDLLETIRQDPAQVAVAGLREDMELLYTRLTHRWPHIGVIRSRSTLVDEYWFLELTPPEVSKARALAFLGKRYAVVPKEMIAVGDNYNDLDMIEYAGLGVAVGNAPDDVRAVADVIAPANDEEGVAHIIEEYLL